MPGRYGRWESLHVLRPYRDKSGYLKVSLRCYKQRKSYFVHTLVATAFHGLRPDGQVICHRNGVRTDNREENLMYGTQQENIQQAVTQGRMTRGDRSHLARLTEAQAAEILGRLQAGEPGASLAREFGVTNGTVSSLKTGRTWRHLSAASEGTIQ